MRSFDIYDTALVRIYLRPQDVFAAVEARLKQEGRPSGFLKLRIQAEAQAARQAPHEEATLDEIYQALQEISGWDMAHIRTALAHELDEESHVYAVRHAQELIATARREYGAILFISDMYLPVSFIKTRLSATGLSEPEDLVFVSSEERASKRHGTLYPRLRKKFPHWLSHYGDNIRADIAMARLHDLEAEHCTVTQATEWEKRLRARFPEKSRFAGAIRVARLSAEAHPASAIGAGLSGPLLHEWLRWLNDVRQRDGVTTLWCALREGELISLACALYEPTLARPLPVSRQALWRCLYTTPVDTLPDWIIDTDQRSLCATLENLSLKPQDWASVLETIGWKVTEQNKRLSWTSTQKKRLLNFLRHPRVALILESQTQAHLERALRFFRDLGVPQTGVVGFVDIGWSGTIQHLWQRVLAAGGWQTTIIGYYFCLEKNPHAVEARTYLTGEARDVFSAHDHHVLECLLPSCVGQVAGYSESAADHHAHTTFVPCFTEAIQASALQFCRIAISLNLELPSPSQWLPDFLKCPPPDLAHLIGSARFTSGSSPGVPLLPENMLVVMQDGAVRLHWPEGWLARTLTFAPPKLRTAIIRPASMLFRLVRKYSNHIKGRKPPQAQP